MSIAVVILNWNGKEDTLSCLKSLKESSYSPYLPIIVDNGSVDNSCLAISKAFPEAHLISTGKNLGYAEGNNVGIRYALQNNCNLILLLNNDTEVYPLFLEKLIKEMEVRPDISILGARPLLFSSPDKLDHLGGKWNAEKGEFDLVGLHAPAGFVLKEELDYVCGCSILIRSTVFQTIGLLEADYFLFWEEADFCMRAKKAGFNIGICNEALLRHKVSASFIGGSIHKTYFWWRNRFLWMERNLSKKEYFFLFWKIIAPKLLKNYKLFFIKSIELIILGKFKPKNALLRKKQKVGEYKAVLQGFHHFLKRRFGNGPSWIFQKVH